MKNMKRIATLLLALSMIFTLAFSVSAETVAVSAKGSILIKDNDSVLASQKTFSAYKVLDVKVYMDSETNEITSYAYSVPTELKDFYAVRYSLDKTAFDFDAKVAANIAIEEDIYAFAEDVLVEAMSKMSGYSGTPVDGGYKFLNLDLGYYVIADITSTGNYIKPVSALILDTTAPNIEIEVKAEKPPVDKKIDKDNDLTTDNDRAESNQAAIGDTITYVITSKVPDMTGYDKYFFIIQDTMSKGLDYTNNMKITVGNKTLAAGTDYTITTTENRDGTTSLKVVFNNFLQYNAAYVDQPIVVTYTAKLNNDAVINPDANSNSVYLQYSNDPTVDYDGENEPNDDEEPLGETPQITVNTYTTALEIIKTDPLGNRLTGAEFELTGDKTNIVRVEFEEFKLNTNDGTYWKLKNGSFTTTDPNGDLINKDNYVSLTDKYVKETKVEFITTSESVNANGTVGEDGILRFEGLSEGDYTITEIKAPDGYNILTETLSVTIDWDESNNAFTYTGAAASNGIAQVTIINQTGTELPSTGGMGTTLFYVFGGIMVLAAVVLLVTKKRMAQ